LQAAVRSGAWGDRGMMRVCDRPDDGKSEAESATAGSGLRPEALEGLKDAYELGGWDERASVGDTESRVSVPGVGFNFDLTSGEVMLRRVRDEVRSESLDKDRVTGGAGWVECDDRLELAQVVGPQRLADGGRDVHGLVTDEPTPAKGELRQPINQPLLLLADRRDVSGHRAEGGWVRIRIGERRFYKRKLKSDRRAELVRHVGDKAFAAREACRSRWCPIRGQSDRAARDGVRDAG
jgi:hypothetical protein